MTGTMNGTARSEVYRLLDGNPTLTREQLSQALGGTPGARQCGNLRRDWVAAKAALADGTAPAGASPAGTLAGAPAAPEAAIPAIQELPREETGRRSLTTARRPAQRRGPAGERGADDRLERWGRLLVCWGCAGIALLMSYSHIRWLGIRAGVAWPDLLPLTVDLLMVAGWMCLRRHPRYLLARVSVALGVAGSMALNAFAARPELVAMADIRLAAALVVPLSAVVSMHLALKR